MRCTKYERALALFISNHTILTNSVQSQGMRVLQPPPLTNKGLQHYLRWSLTWAWQVRLTFIWSHINFPDFSYYFLFFIDWYINTSDNCHGSVELHISTYWLYFINLFSKILKVSTPTHTHTHNLYIFFPNIPAHGLCGFISLQINGSWQLYISLCLCNGAFPSTIKLVQHL